MNSCSVVGMIFIEVLTFLPHCSLWSMLLTMVLSGFLDQTTLDSVMELCRRGNSFCITVNSYRIASQRVIFVSGNFRTRRGEGSSRNFRSANFRIIYTNHSTHVQINVSHTEVSALVEIFAVFICEKYEIEHRAMRKLPAILVACSYHVLY